MRRWNIPRAAAFFAVTALSCASAGAITLDWDTNTWTNANNGNVQANSFDVDPNNAGNDVTIDFSGQTSKLRTEPVSGTQTPAVMSTLTGGLTPVEKSLHVYASVGTQTQITVSVTFAASYVKGVEGVSFKLFDIDKGSDSEYVKTIYGIGLDGTQVPATITEVGPSVSLSNPGSLSQQLTGIAPAGDTTGDGNATISFAVPITGFTFTFDNSQGPPRVQEFALYDISFSPVPEMNPALSAAVSCFAAIGLVFHHRARVRRAGRK